MFVLVNGRPVAGVLAGIARYTRMLYRTIIGQRSAEVRFWHHGRVTRSMPQQSTFAPWLKLPAGALQILRIGGTVWNDYRLDGRLKNDSFDVYHETAMFPGRGSNRLPTVFTIYDLSLLRFPDTHPADRVRQFERYFFKRMASVEHTLTISRFMRTEIVNLLGIQADRVTATPLAASPVFWRRSKKVVKQFLSRHGLPDAYMLYVGTLEPRKNLLQVVRAMAGMPTSLALVCAGWRGWLNNEFNAAVERLRLTRRIIQLGHCTDEDLALLYSGASVFLYPSLYEGFGLPVLEAMACGCPVICSDRASLPEVVGNAAIQVPPDDDELLAEKLDELLSDEALRGRLIDAGYERAAGYSWEDTARRTVAVFERLCR